MHKPVLLEEVVEVLDPRRGEFFVDGTVNGGGHLASILEKMLPEGRILAVDWDKELLAGTKLKIETKFKTQGSKLGITWINDNFKNMRKIFKTSNLEKADGLLLDLGFSSEHLESASGRTGRGFSFKYDEPLVMAYSGETRPAMDWLKRLNVREITKIIRQFGEEKFAGRIAKAIKDNLPISTSKKLAEVIEQAVPNFYRHGRIHPATRTFQALRIFVNQELDNLRSILEDLPEIIAPGGRVAIISFHSLEDRLVKQSFQKLCREGLAEFLAKKPITPRKEEIFLNPRSRSAKLRAVKFL